MREETSIGRLITAIGFDQPYLLDLESMTWVCMVCRDERPDPVTAVAHRPIAGLGHLFPGARFNVLYCTDRAGCVAEATASGPWHGPTRTQATPDS